MQLLRIVAFSVALFALAAIAAGEPTTGPAFDEPFVTLEHWTPRAGIKIESVPAEGRDGRCLHLQGLQDQAWNYVARSPIPLKAGRKYRFTAWLRVGEGFSGYPPFCQIECIAAGSDGRPDWSTSLGQFNSASYEPLAGGWQELSMEFEAPARAAWGSIILEKGVKDPIQIDAWLAGVRVVEVAAFTIPALLFEQVPRPLAAMKGVHPRLYLTSDQWDQLKQKLGREPYKSMLAKVVRIADSGVKDGPPAYAQPDAKSDDEQLWQRPMANMMPHLAMAYRLTGDAKYLRSAEAFIRASTGYKTWGTGQIDGKDLAAGHQLYGMAVAYDWLYNDLDTQTRQIARQCMETRGRFMFEQLMAGKVWWHRSYLQNHQWVNMTGLAMAGLTLYGEAPGVDGWINLTLKKYRLVMKALGPDGASQEGVPYWSYGLEYLLKFMDPARELLGENLYKNNAWLANTTSFRLYSMLPRNAWKRGSDLFNFADGPRADWYGPDYLMRRLAGEYRDGRAQWLADELAKSYLCGDEATFLNLIWFDPSVASEIPSSTGAAPLPTFKHFADLGLVFMRSGWGGDESVMAFKCGPALGNDATRRLRYDAGAGHAHPDAGSFQLFAHGDWLIVGSGYSFKRTVYENTLLVNGTGQADEGGPWNTAARVRQERQPTILRAESGSEFDMVTADAAPAYDARLGLTRFLRHVIYFRPDCWLMVDELEADKPAEFTLSLHADYPFQNTAPGFRVHGVKGELTVTPLWPLDAAAKAGQQSIQGSSGEPEHRLELLTLSNPVKEKSAVFVTLLEAHASGSDPGVVATVERSDRGLLLTIRLREETRKYLIDLKRANAGDAVLRAEEGIGAKR